MPYTTQANLVARFGQEELERYADDGAGGIDSARVDAAIADADETIDLYIASAVTLPLDPVPGIIAKLSADIARYLLQDDNPLDEARVRYEDAIARLRDISTGKASIGVTSGGSLNVGVVREDVDRIFTRESLADF